jgi:hypothetical protein
MSGAIPWPCSVSPSMSCYARLMGEDKLGTWQPH